MWVPQDRELTFRGCETLIILALAAAITAGCTTFPSPAAPDLRIASAAAPDRDAWVITAAVAHPSSRALTIYAGGWALVTDARQLSLEPGRQTVQFSDVPREVEAKETLLQLPARIAEMRFRSDLASRNDMYERYSGSEVEIELPASGLEPRRIVKATLINTDQGPMYRLGDRLYPEAPGKVSLPLAGSSVLSPTLEWEVDAPAAWTGLATASYVTRQLGWQTAYTLVTDVDQGSGQLTQWADISNRSGATFQRSRVVLIAGEVRRGRMGAFQPGARASMPMAAPTPQIAPVGFAARYEYDVPEALTLENGSDRRLSLSAKPGVKIERTYRTEQAIQAYRTIDPELPIKAQIRLTLQNSAAGGLDLPLPAGPVAVYTPDSAGRLAVEGESQIPDTPVGQAILLDIGEAFDLTAKRTQTLFEEHPNQFKVGYRVELTNQQNRSATIDLVEDFPGDWTITAASMPFEKPSALQARWRVPIPARSSRTLTFEAEIKRFQPR